MNCESFYIVEDGSLEKAKECARIINYTAVKQREEVYAVCISKAKKDFYGCPDFDGTDDSFLVKAGTWLVFAQGKNYCMYRLDVDYKMGFPDRERHTDFYSNIGQYIENIAPV